MGDPRRMAWSLTCGGLGVLMARQVLTLVGVTASADSVLLSIGAVAGYALLGGGVWLSLRPSAVTAQPSPLPPALPPAPPPAPPVADDGCHRAIETILDWLARQDQASELWRPFDQLVRELLGDQLGAERVRVWRLCPASGELVALATGQSQPIGGILGHVATIGRSYCAHDAQTGQMIRELAGAGDERYDWVFPIVEDARIVGVVAAAHLGGARAKPERRAAVERLVTFFWLFVDRTEQLRVSRVTDKASGMLTRADFFSAAERALTESAQLHEPTVAVVISLEGLRGLDDAGRWRERDEIVERVAELIVRRVRAEDVAGRFADDRFVLLLRRLDGGLGQLMVDKFVAAIRQELTTIDAAREVCVRGALAGGGARTLPLVQAFASAFDVLESGRRESVVGAGEPR